LLLEQVAERSEAQVEILLFEAERPRRLFHAPLEPFERGTELLDLLVAERSRFHPGERLPLHELAQELDDGENELGEASLDIVWIRVEPRRRSTSCRRLASHFPRPRRAPRLH